MFALLPYEEEPCVCEPDDPDALLEDGEPLELQLANRTAASAHKMTTAERNLYLRVCTAIPSALDMDRERASRSWASPLNRMPNRFLGKVLRRPIMGLT